MTGLERCETPLLLTVPCDTPLFPLDLIERHRGVKLVVEDLPLEDPKTYELFSRGLTSGVFQFESPGMRQFRSFQELYGSRRPVS